MDAETPIDSEDSQKVHRRTPGCQLYFGSKLFVLYECKYFAFVFILFFVNFVLLHLLILTALRLPRPRMHQPFLLCLLHFF
eukprot:jgi/Botrbrau1/18746/Bobra.0386s0069.1